MVEYATETARERAAFEQDFPQLYYRIKTLEDKLTAHFLRGATVCLVSYEFRATTSPYFLRVAFDDRAAREYEAFMRKFFSTRKNAVCSVLPRPSFSVQIGVCFGNDVCETFDFPFAAYSEETVLDFCTRVETRAAVLFRHRYSAGKF